MPPAESRFTRHLRTLRLPWRHRRSGDYDVVVRQGPVEEFKRCKRRARRRQQAVVTLSDLSRGEVHSGQRCEYSGFLAELCKATNGRIKQLPQRRKQDETCKAAPSEM